MLSSLFTGAILYHQTNQYAAPVSAPPPVDSLYSRLDEPSEMKGSPQACQMHICRCEALKRALEILGSRQPKKQGDFVITKSQNQAAQREKSWDFL